MARKKFPVLALIILVFALTWFLRELGYFDVKLPWIPLILVIIAIGMIFNRLKG